MVGEPPAPLTFAEHVVAYVAGAGRRVNDAIASGIDGDVVDTIPVVREEEQISGSQWLTPRHFDAGRREARGAARQTDPRLVEGVLDEPRSVASAVGTPSSRPVPRR